MEKNSRKEISRKKYMKKREFLFCVRKKKNNKNIHTKIGFIEKTKGGSKRGV